MVIFKCKENRMSKNCGKISMCVMEIPEEEKKNRANKYLKY